MTTTVPLHGTGDLASFRVASGLAKHGALLGEQLEYVATDTYGVPHAVFSPNPDPRPLAVRTVHDHALSDAELAEVERFYASSGRTLVEYNPMTRESVGAAIPPYTKGLRDRLALRMRNVKHPHQLEIQAAWDADGNPHEVRILRAPQTDRDDAASRAEFWTSLIDDELPAPDGQDWRFTETKGFEGRQMVLTLRRDPLLGIRPYPEDSVATYERLPFGVDEDGNEVSLGLYEQNILLGGLPGGGKSGGLTALLTGAASLPHVALIGADPKEVELPIWESRFSCIATHPAHALAVMEAVVEEMGRRYAMLRKLGLKKVPVEMFPQVPLLLFPADELAELVASGEPGDKERALALKRTIQKGRAAAISVIAATQKPGSDTIPTGLRDIIQQRIAYATTNADMTDTILGAGMSQAGGVAHTIPTAKPYKGIAYMLNEDSRVPRRIRTYWVPDDEVAEVAQRYAHLRVDLPWLPTEAQALAAAASKNAPKKAAARGDW